MIIYPEGTRSQDGYIKKFKKGISIFSQRTKTPILFIYLQGAAELMPKGSLPGMGRVQLYVGPVQQPAAIEEIDKNYKEWVLTINPKAYREDSTKS